MEVNTLTVGQLATNCYFLSNKKSETIIIDPGDNADYLSEQILINKLRPICILLTHGHFDHHLGSLELFLNFNLPIYLHSQDKTIFDKSLKSAQYWLKSNTPPAVNINYFESSLPHLITTHFPHLSFIHTPGHTPGSVCYYSQSPTNPLLFSGDTLFFDGIGDTSHPYSNKTQLLKSLNTLFSLPPQTKIFPGHGETTFINLARSTIQPILNDLLS